MSRIYRLWTGVKREFSPFSEDQAESLNRAFINSIVQEFVLTTQVAQDMFGSPRQAFTYCWPAGSS